MKPLVIIVGTCHRLQTGHVSYSSAQHASFADFLEATRKKHRIKFFAEEMTDDVLKDFGVTATIAKGLADRKKLKHAYVDLSGSDRCNLGIDRVSLYFKGQASKLGMPQFAVLEQLVGELRECIWLVRVLEENRWPVLFICGANHVPHLQKLFNSVGKPAEIAANDFQAK